MLAPDAFLDGPFRRFLEIVSTHNYRAKHEAADPERLAGERAGA